MMGMMIIAGAEGRGDRPVRRRRRFTLSRARAEPLALLAGIEWQTSLGKVSRRDSASHEVVL